MAEESPKLWPRIKGAFRFWLASLAMRYCGPELIYWIEPGVWDDYMACPICADRIRYEAGGE